MAGSPSVLLLDDGELDDVQKMLEGMEISFGRVRGGAIVPGMSPPKDLLITTPRRIDVIKAAASAGAEPPTRVVIVNEDSNTLRDHLRKAGFDYLVRRPVHPEALRLLLLHSLYRGEEKRGDPRVAVGYEISFRAGLLNRRATLADLSMRGCRLLSHTRFDVGKRLKLQIPEALETGDPFTIAGRIVRVDFDAKAGDGGLYSAGVLFDKISDNAREALEMIIEDRANGPAMLRRPPRVAAKPQATQAEKNQRAKTEDIGRPVAAEDDWEETSSAQVEITVDVKMDTEPESIGAPSDQRGGPERRESKRGAYEQTVPAFGNRALRVLVGRDLSLGGMRIAHQPSLELGDRLHLAIYGDPGDPPFLVWGTVSRDDGDRGMALVFDPVEPEVGHHLERLVADLPAVEALHDSEVQAMGTVMSEIIDD